MARAKSKNTAKGSKALLEETLDPENWDEIRTLGHHMLDDMIDHQRDIASMPFSFTTKEAIEDICVHLTDEGEGEEKVYEVFQRSIRPYLLMNAGPRFWGAVVGTGSPYGMLAEMLTGGLNSNVEAIAASGYVHKQVIDWIKEMLGYPAEAGGVLVSGGSEANFTGLAVARNAKAEVDMKAKGIQNVPRRMTLYVSDEGHHCLERSVEILGLGNESLRWVPTDDDCRIKLDALRKAIAEDRKGLPPLLRHRVRRNREQRSLRRPERPGGHRCQGEDVVPRGRRLRRLGEDIQDPQAPCGRHGAGRLPGRRPPQVDVHALRDRLHPRQGQARPLQRLCLRPRGPVP
jgi:hypothetical protein